MCWRQTNAAQLLNCAARIRRQRQSEKLKGLILMCRICCSPPGNLGNHTGRLAVYKPFTGSPKVLLITTQGRPTHLTCGQTILRIMIPRSRSWQKRATTPSFRSKYIAQSQQLGRHLLKEWQLCYSLSWRFFRSSHIANSSRSLRRERTRMAGIDFSSYRMNVSFPRSPYSLGKRRDCDIKFKFLFK